MPNAAVARNQCPLVYQWMQDNYSTFLRYAIKNFRADLGTHEDREDAISDLVVKTLSTNAFEARLAEGKNLSFGSLLHFCEQRHFHNMDRAGRDLLGRAHGKRTRKEIREGEIEYGCQLPDYGGEAIRLPADEDSESRDPSAFDVVDPGPSPLDMVVVDETYELIMGGMLREWDDAPLETRLRVLELLRSGGNQGDIQRMLDVGPTRAKTFKKEIREVVNHALRPRTFRPRKQATPAPSPSNKLEDLLPKHSDDGTLKGTDIPQHDRLDEVEMALRARCGYAVEGTLPESRRHRLYLEQACRVLGLFDSNGQVTKAGEQIASSGFTKAVNLLFESSAVGRQWLRWAKVNGVGDLDPASSESFLADCSDLSASTQKRRARTLKRWAAFVQQGC